MNTTIPKDQPNVNVNSLLQVMGKKAASDQPRFHPQDVMDWCKSDVGLQIWRSSVTDGVRKNVPDFSARQMAIVLAVYMDDRVHTVRGLAAYLRISKPAVSRALDRLGEFDYISRQRDEYDRRSVLVNRTPEGEKFLRDFSGMIKNAMDSVADFPVLCEKSHKASAQVA